MGSGGDDYNYKPEEVLYQSPSLKPEKKSSNPKDRAATCRLDMSLFPQTAIAYGALSMTEGDLKYAGYNYREEGVAVSTYISALMRHMTKFYNGEWEDATTKVPHLASMIACVAVMIDGFVKGNIKDDRPPKLDMAGLLTEFEAKVKHLQGLFPNPPARCTEENSANKKA